jgi:hypothetical protein
MLEMIEKKAIPNAFAEVRRPIEFLTENGFSIIRLCDIDNSIPTVGATHEFLVGDPYGYELHITVHISSNPMAEIDRRSWGRISKDNSYWIALAERHLATYLWEKDDYPPNASLEVDHLTLEDLDLARRWDRDF